MPAVQRWHPSLVPVTVAAGPGPVPAAVAPAWCRLQSPLAGGGAVPRPQPPGRQ